jgi:3-hydroxyisobutyrate dehydrogenase-like beta-hydroxyacid dehydrogenase
MGSGMAANLLDAGHALTVYNRTPAKAEALVAEGARLAETPREAARGDVVITMLADDAAVESVAFGPDGILAGLKALSIHISMSTISVALAERLASAHQAARQRFVAAPVFGRPEAAAAAKLFIVAAGEPKTVQACQPLFKALGQHTFVIADEPPKANLVKLSGNFLIGAVIETLGEARPCEQGRNRPSEISRHSHQHAVRSACIQNLWRDHRRGALRASRFQGEAGLQGYPFGPWSGGSLTGTHARCEPPPRPLPSAAGHRWGRSRLVCLAALASRDAGEPSSLLATK